MSETAGGNRALEAAIERLRRAILQALILADNGQDRLRIYTATSEALARRLPYQDGRSE